MSTQDIPTTGTGWRALCTELVNELDASNGFLGSDGEWVIPEPVDTLVTRARTALAQPEPAGPTVMEIIAMADEIEEEGLGQVDLVRRALARWGRPTIQPVPVAERLPEVEDCDADGFCWFWDLEWSRWQPGEQDQSCTHWLPAHALPIPTSQED